MGVQENQLLVLVERIWLEVQSWAIDVSTDQIDALLDGIFADTREEDGLAVHRAIDTIAGLEALNRPCEVDVYSDSQYVIKAFQDGWLDSWQRKGWKKSDGKPVLNVDLWKRLLAAAEPHEITWHWVKGHAGHPENERCDRLATAAADALK